MLKINRSMLAQSQVAGGASKSSGDVCPVDTPTPTQSGSASTKVVVNGKTVVNQTVTV